ncbi:hypothetical protein ACTNCI_05875 [Mitsuokella jalaludinii]|uniref:hypothetical protein n=1 Tax=Mitsuokella jalaludinii TaxID=187979 RepID=UPI003F8B9672
MDNRTVQSRNTIMNDLWNEAVRYAEEPLSAPCDMESLRDAVCKNLGIGGIIDGHRLIPAQKVSPQDVFSSLDMEDESVRKIVQAALFNQFLKEGHWREGGIKATNVICNLNPYDELRRCVNEYARNPMTSPLDPDQIRMEVAGLMKDGSIRIDGEEKDIRKLGSKRFFSHLDLEDPEIYRILQKAVRNILRDDSAILKEIMDTQKARFDCFLEDKELDGDSVLHLIFHEDERGKTSIIPIDDSGDFLSFLKQDPDNAILQAAVEYHPEMPALTASAITQDAPEGKAFTFIPAPWLQEAMQEGHPLAERILDAVTEDSSVRRFVEDYVRITEEQELELAVRCAVHDVHNEFLWNPDAPEPIENFAQGLLTLRRGTFPDDFLLESTGEQPGLTGYTEVLKALRDKPAELHQSDSDLIDGMRDYIARATKEDIRTFPEKLLGDEREDFLDALRKRGRTLLEEGIRDATKDKRTTKKSRKSAGR